MEKKIKELEKTIVLLGNTVAMQDVVENLLRKKIDSLGEKEKEIIQGSIVFAVEMKDEIKFLKEEVDKYKKQECGC